MQIQVQLNLKDPKSVIDSSIETACSRELECKGECWLNVAGCIDVWQAVASKCKGTKHEQKLINDAFHGCIGSKEELLDLMGATIEVRNLLEGTWK